MKKVDSHFPYKITKVQHLQNDDKPKRVEFVVEQAQNISEP